MLIKEQLIEVLKVNPDITLLKAQKVIPRLKKSYFYRVKKEWKGTHQKNTEIVRIKDFKKRILNILNEKPSGLTIKDIAEDIKAARNTVSKYLAILEATNKVFTKKVGVYKLYFSADRGMVSKKLMSSLYLGLLSGLKHEINDTEKFKNIGLIIGDQLGFPLGFSYSSEHPDDIKLPNIERFFNYVGNSMLFIDFIFKASPDIKTETNGNKATFTITNVDLFDQSESFFVHFHILSGIIEGIISKSLKKEVRCDIEYIDVKNQSVQLSLEIDLSPLVST